MEKLRATVKKGRFVIDTPTTLPDGTVLDLVVDDEGDDLTDAERERLYAALERAAEDVKAGRVRSAEEVIEELRRRR
jgi:hypothetical protein